MGHNSAERAGIEAASVKLSMICRATLFLSDHDTQLASKLANRQALRRKLTMRANDPSPRLMITIEQTLRP
jgi:hypothetical protein